MAKFSVKKPMTVFVGVVIVFVLGYVAFTHLTTDMLPDMDLPYVVVLTPYPGSSPEKVEMVITQPLEEKLSQLSGLKHIISKSSENSSQIVLEFSYNTDLNAVIVDLQGQIERIRDDFPAGVKTPTISRVSANDMALSVISVEVNGLNTAEMNDLISNEITPSLSRVEGVASANVAGLITKRIELRLNQAKIDEVNNQLLRKVNKELALKEQEIQSKRQELEKAKNTVSRDSESAYRSLRKKKTEIDDELSNAKAAYQQVKASQKQLADSKAQLQTAINSALGAQKEALNRQMNTLLENEATLNDQAQTLQDGIKQGEEALAQIESSEKRIDSSKYSSESQIIQNEAKLDLAEAEFAQRRDEALSQSKIGTVVSDKLSDIIMAQNFSMPVGQISGEQGSFTVKVEGEISTIDQLAETELYDTGEAGIGMIKVKDVADIVEADNKDSTFVKINGKDGVVIEVRKQSSYSSNKASSNLRKQAKDLEKQFGNVRFSFLSDQGSYIEIVIQSVLDNLMMGGGLAIVILIIFLKDIKPTLVIACSIPISVLLAVVLMYFSGVNMNIISLAGLALGVGMLVDNSVVTLENIYRLRSEGMPAAKAAVKGTLEIAGAIAASTLTTICVFLPILFTEGMSKQLFSDMGLTITYSLIASLIVALTVVPAMSATLLKSITPKETPFFDKVKDFYGATLAIVIKFKWISLLAATALFIASLSLLKGMGTSAIPSSDSNEIMLNFESPDDFSREDTEEAIYACMDIIRGIEDIETVGALYVPPSHKATLFAVLRHNRQLSSEQMASEAVRRSSNLGCDLTISSTSAMSSVTSGNGVEVRVTGENVDTLREIANDIGSRMSMLPGVAVVTNGSEVVSDELRITPNKNKASQYGLTVAQVYQIVNEAMSTETSAGQYYVVKPNSGEVTKDTIKDITIRVSENGVTKDIALGEIVEFTDAVSLPVINHDNQRRYITIAGSLNKGFNIGLVSKEVENFMKELSMPKGYSWRLVGDIETINDYMNDLIFVLYVAFILIFLIIVAQFQSIVGPLIIMLTIPLAFTGGLFALSLLKFDLSVIAMLGFLVLAGVIVNNGIVLVEFIIQLRVTGYDRNSAIITASQTRLRPILITSLTTILGLVTMAMGVGQGSEMLQPMAVVVLFGLTYGTFMTLFIVPCLYEIFMKKQPIVVDIGDLENQNDFEKHEYQGNEFYNPTSYGEEVYTDDEYFDEEEEYEEEYDEEYEEEYEEEEYEEEYDEYEYYADDDISADKLGASNQKTSKAKNKMKSKKTWPKLWILSRKGSS